MIQTENKTGINGIKPEMLLLIVISTSLASFSIAFMTSSVNIAIPGILKDFNVNAVMMSWITASYLLSTAVFSVPAGRLADIYGRKKIFLAGCIFFTVFSFLSGFAFNFIFFIILRALQGISSGMIFSTALALLTVNTENEKRGMIIGINVFSVYIGLTAGPLLGGVITQMFGWRSIFFLCGMLGIISLSMILFIREKKPDAAVSRKFDPAGTVLFGLFLSLILIGFSRLPSISAVVMIAISLLSFAGFILVEMKISNPLIDIRIFGKNRTFLFSSIAALINYSTTYGVTFIMSLYLQYNKGLSPLKSGLILAIQPLSQAIFAPLSGKLSDKIEPQIIASAGLVFSLAALIFISLFNTGTSFVLIIIILFISGLGIALFSSPNTNAIMSSADKNIHGVASAIVATMRLIGQTFSMGIILVVFNLIFGGIKLTKESAGLLTDSMKIIFIVFAALCLAGVFFSLIRGKIKKQTI